MTSKTVDYYLSLPYPIELIPDEGGYWFARIPLLDGCITNGESREDALYMLDDAFRGWLESAIEHGLNIPEPKLVEL